MMTFHIRSDRSEKVPYDDRDYPFYIRRSLLSSYPGFAAPSHWHDDVEFNFVLSGRLGFSVNGQNLLLTAGEAVFVNAGQLHFGFAASPGEECEFLCLVLHPVLLCAAPAYERDFVAPVLSSCTAFLQLTESVPWQREVLSKLRQIYASKGKKAAPLLTLSHFAELWALLSQNLPPAPHGKKPSTDLTLIRRMMGFIQNHYAERITLADIAAAGAVGESKCCRLFARYLRQSPIAFLNQQRLLESAKLLRETDLPLGEIAEKAGFGGGSYFAESFKKWAGCSPSAYRKAEQK